MNLASLTEEFVRQKKKLHIFLSIKKDDKIMENTIRKVLYIEPPGYFQFIKRWWYGEDKKKTFAHLDTYFIEFMRFLDAVLLFIKQNDDERIIVLGNDICAFINRIIPGIHTLKTTYPEYKALHDKIASIIITMLDFKEEYRTKTSGDLFRDRALSF